MPYSNNSDYRRTSRGRGRARGRGRTRPSRGRSANNTSRPRSFSHRNNDILRTILNRLDQLEGNSSRSRRSTHNNDRDGHRNSPRRTSRPPIQDGTRSRNPDFRRLVKTQFQCAQTAQHLKNWTSCPRAIQKMIDHLINQIKPPAMTDQFQRDLQHAAEDFKSAIIHGVQRHLRNQEIRIRRDFENLDKLDITLARDVATKQLQHRLGDRLHQPTIRKALDQLTRSSQNITPPTVDDDWHVVTTRTPPHRRTTTSVAVPIANRFDLLPTENDDSGSPPPTSTRRRQLPTTEPVLTYASAVTSPRRNATAPHSGRSSPSSTPVPDTPSLRPTMSPEFPLPAAAVSVPQQQVRRRQRSSPSSDEEIKKLRLEGMDSFDDAELGALLDQLVEPPPPKPDRRVHPPNQKNSWAIQPLKPGMHTLIIADSNGLSLAHTDLPSGSTLDVFRGAGIQHLVPMLEAASTRLSEVDTIITAVGLNNRLSPTTEFVTHLHELKLWARDNNKRLVFSAIPIIPSLPLETKNTLHQLNQIAMDLLEHFLDSVDEDHIQLVPHDSSALHYDTQTAKLVMNNILNFLKNE